jgi:ferredoxin-thioredoxin reductase catalytic subunit
MSEVAKYVYVDDAEHVERIKKGIERKTEKYGAGYCPCVGPAAHNEDTICPCKEYRETGHCHCKMYKE